MVKFKYHFIIYLWIPLLIFISDCSKNQYSKKKNYVPIVISNNCLTKNLNHKQFNNGTLFFPSSINILDSLLLLIDQQNDKLLKIYKIKNKTLSKEAFRIGKGPNEF